MANYPLSLKQANVAFSVPISDEEKEKAVEVRKQFESVLKSLEEFDRYLKVFFDHIDDLADKEDLTSISTLLHKYELKLKIKFNELLEAITKTLQEYLGMLSDTELDNLKDLIIDAVKNLREGLVGFLKLLNDVKDESFVSNVKGSYPSISKIIDQIRILIKKDLFNHIDLDILGKITI